MRSAIHLSLVLVVCAGCAMQSTPPTRENPAGTIEAFKQASRTGDLSAEWDILSPDLKRRVSERAGRTVDESDWRLARQEMRSDPQVRLAEQMLQTASIQSVVPEGPDRARVTVHIGPPGPAGRTAVIGMVRLTHWELQVADDPQPYSGFIGSSEMNVREEPDGGYTVWSEDAAGNVTHQETFGSDQVVDYRTVTKWYVDDLGSLEAEFGM